METCKKYYILLPKLNYMYLIPEHGQLITPSKSLCLNQNETEKDSLIPFDQCSILYSSQYI